MNIQIPYVDQYIDVVLAMPIMLSLLLVEWRILFGSGKNYRLNLLEVIIATIFVAFVSEFMFPALSSAFTADWLDILGFILGGIIFYLTLNPAAKTNNKLNSDS